MAWASVDLGYKGDDPWSYYFAFFGGVGAPGMTKKHQERRIINSCTNMLLISFGQSSSNVWIWIIFWMLCLARSSGPSTGLGMSPMFACQPNVFFWLARSGALPCWPSSPPSSSGCWSAPSVCRRGDACSGCRSSATPDTAMWAWKLRSWLDVFINGGYLCIHHRVIHV